ncbi:RsmD family RNA methyltransferase [Lysinibacter cavernae]|uniref:16S rRNA (Guanine966-N2)-methyltransferase n=1 Tax=Lysinibacter cavernae TaxID=1640652 RepID=A0A7X5QYV5_9MICO|nr:16S rRNA (guanine966-N2)-methyltransferase [Lysinibacter cavernae]
MTRIISGFAGSLRLNVPKSGTRPTSDRVREAIFSALDSWEILDGSYVLDLYAGSGALALEAVSRGAVSAVLVEKHPQAAHIAKANAAAVSNAYPVKGATSPKPRIEVVTKTVSSYLDALSADGIPFDVIFIDPPYDLAEDHLATDLIAVSQAVSADGVVLVERSSRSPEPTWPAASATSPGLVQFRRKDYGETVLWWAERADREVE